MLLPAKTLYSPWEVNVTSPSIVTTPPIFRVNPDIEAAKIVPSDSPNNILNLSSPT